MDNWLLSALMALLIFGFWGFFPKLAVQYIGPDSAIIYQVMGGVLAAGGLMYFRGGGLEAQPLGILFALLTGVAGVLGTLFYFHAASRGAISVVVSITALYPLITIFLAVIFLHETLSIKQIVGLAFALLAIILLST